MLKVRINQEFPIVTLGLEGELDLSTGSILHEVITSMNLDGITSIIFSLDALKYIDSTGIGQLIGYYRSFAKQNCKMYIENENADIEEVLELIGVREIISS